MKIVGLSGGIATGKSTVSSEIEHQKVPVIDCDKIAHAVVKQVTLLTRATNFQRYTCFKLSLVNYLFAHREDGDTSGSSRLSDQAYSKMTVSCVYLSAAS